MDNHTRAQKPLAITELFTNAFKFNGVNCIIKNLNNFVLLNLTLKYLNIDCRMFKAVKKLYQKPSEYPTI